MSIQYAMLLLYLCIETKTDIKRKEISGIHWLIAGILLFISSILAVGLEKVLGGMVPGILLLALSSVTKGAIGAGDAMVLMICGMVLGIERVSALFIIALLLLVPISMWKIIYQKVSKKYELAFLPYLLASYLCILCIS